MQRVMVIGWDCSDFRLIDPWLKDGYLPNLQKLMNISKHGILRSINPPVTPIAWSTIVTGKNPGKHSISGFMSFKNNAYKTYPVNASDRHAKDIWELIGDHGKKVAVVGVPLTFPTRRVNGCMISGFLTPNELVDYCYPKELKQEILTKIPGYAVTPANFSRNFSDFSSERHDDESVNSVFSILQKHIDAMIYIAKEKEWDFLMGVFNETDWVQHRFWSCIDKSHPKFDEKRAHKYRDIIRDVHIRLDDALGELLNLADDANVLLISDHGVGPLYWNINTNYLLYKMGKLTFKRTPQSGTRFILARLGFSSSKMITLMRKLQLSLGLDTYVAETSEMHDVNERSKEDKSDSTRDKYNSASLAIRLAKSLILSVDDVDWTKSIAFARVGHGEIFLNREELFPKGIVKDSDYTKLRTELIEELRIVKNDGHPVMGEVYSRENLFSGQYFNQCQDIQLQPVEGYVSMGGFTFGLNKPFIPPEASYAGHHSLNGIIVIREKGYESLSRTIEGACLLDVVPTILHLMQLPIPEDLDGKSFADNPQKPPTVQIKVDSASGPGTSFEYSKQEEEDLEDRLRSLGYI